MPHITSYYCINAGELDHIIHQGMEKRLKWHKMNSFVRAINLAHYGELKPHSWSISIGREPNKVHQELPTPSINEMLRPLKERGVIMAEGEYREWEFFKRLYHSMPKAQELDEEIVEDYLFYADKNIFNLIKRVYGRWYSPGVGLREVSDFFPDIADCFIPFINDFPYLRSRLEDEVDKDFFFNYDPEKRVMYIPNHHVSKVIAELEKHKNSFTHKLETAGWEHKDAENLVVPFLFDILEYAKLNERSIMMRI
ncbi:MAG: hypothetical protein LWY06_09670 [Firmicutes bacterium]|nr:hypothetical protein [Bacillota bacterium]